MRISSGLLLALSYIGAADAAPFVMSLNEQDSNDCTDKNQLLADLKVDGSFIDKVKDFMLRPELLPSRKLTQTSHRHQDRVRSSGEMVSNPVAFVMMNTNKDAYFSHGDDDIVPVEEGNLVVFDGSVPHNTVVNSGVVELMGPFDTVTYNAVGEGCSGNVVDESDIACCINVGGHVLTHEYEARMYTGGSATALNPVRRELRSNSERRRRRRRRRNDDEGDDDDEDEGPGDGPGDDFLCEDGSVPGPPCGCPPCTFLAPVVKCRLVSEVTCPETPFDFASGVFPGETIIQCFEDSPAPA